jgi:predicted transcriptional regulator
MDPKKTLFDSIDPAAETDADARAEADVRAGRLISHEAVKRWVSSWGTDTPRPRPEIGE